MSSTDSAPNSADAEADTPAGSDAGADAGASPAISYEQARDELIAVVAALESGGHSLEESLALWERGETLAAICQHWLDNARQRLDDVLAKRSDQGDA